MAPRRSDNTQNFIAALGGFLVSPLVPLVQIQANLLTQLVGQLQHQNRELSSMILYYKNAKKRHQKYLKR